MSRTRTTHDASSLTIDEGVEMGKVSRGTRESKYPWARMEAGQSVSVPADMAKAARASATAFGKANGIKFGYRSQPDGSVRIFCVGARDNSAPTSKRGRKRKGEQTAEA